MDSSQRAKKADLLSQAANLLVKRPQSQFDGFEDEDERFDVDRINSSARRLQRKVQRTSALLPELPGLLSLSGNGDHEPVTRFEHRQREQQVVAQSRGAIKGMTGNQPLQFATRTMAWPGLQQRMLKTPPDSHLGTAPKEHQSIAGPSRTSNHKTGMYTAYTNLGYGEITVNPKTSYARDDTLPSNTGELVDTSVEVTPPSLRPTLTRDYKEDRPSLVHKKKYSCKDCFYSSYRSHNMKRHVITTHGGSRVRTKAVRTNFSSSSEKSSKTESYEGTSAKTNDTRHYFPSPSSPTAYTPGAQINPTPMGSMPPGVNLNAHALQHLSSAAQQQVLQQQLQQQHFNNPQAMAVMRQQQQQQQLLQQNQARQLMAQQAAFQANGQDGLPIELAKSSQLNPKGHYPQAQAILTQQFTLQQHSQATYELLDKLPKHLIASYVKKHLPGMRDEDKTPKPDISNAKGQGHKESTDKRDDGTRRLKTDFRDPSANFSAIGHYTISQDNTEGEEARKSFLLAKFGKRCTRNRDAQELEKQKAMRRDRISF